MAQSASWRLARKIELSMGTLTLNGPPNRKSKEPSSSLTPTQFRSSKGKLGDQTPADLAGEDENEQLDEEASAVPFRTKAQQQRSQFHSWVNQRAEQLAKEEAKALHVRPDADLSQPARILLYNKDKANIINDPREYQLELFERAKTQNTIAVLDTGSGKTLIAVLLLRYILDKELEDRAAGLKPRISFFLVDCVTLVFQQFAVLECNLDVKIDRFCGDMGCDLWVKATWDDVFAKNMVIVCTAEVLYQCLFHGFITIDQINLVIFDEAHHAKKNHPYARIIRDFYDSGLDIYRRPRLFGTTASPVDAKVNIKEASAELEALLHCRIATISDMKLLSQSCFRPTETVELYGPLPPPSMTPLLDQLKPIIGNIPELSKVLDSIPKTKAQLGSWCADRIWSYVFTDEEISKLEGKIERKSAVRWSVALNDKSVDSQIALLAQARKVVDQYSFKSPIGHLSSKVQVLHDFLLEHFERPTNSKCIIFVQERITARLLTDLFSKIGTQHLRVDSLIGTGGNEVGDLNATFRKQVLTMIKFRRGDINCLFATSIAEEGLDIPDCNIVVRFDLYTTLIQYIQSRGRARRPNSKFVHMLERGNLFHHNTLKEVRAGDVILRDFCKSLPEDRLLKGNEADSSSMLYDEASELTFSIESTQAKLTLDSSIGILAHFTSTLPTEYEESMFPSYNVIQRGLNYICEVVIPEPSPILTATGKPSSRKSIAKRSAAFEACMQLYKNGVLDNHLLSTYEKRVPTMRNAQLALSEKAKSSYAKMSKPAFWQQGLGQPVALFLSVFRLSRLQGFPQPFADLGILTRSPLPDIPDFPLHIVSDQASSVSVTSSESSMAISPQQLQMVTSFTARFFQDIFNKIYQDDNTRRAYWVVPVSTKTANHLPAAIDWDTVEQVVISKPQSWERATPQNLLEHKFIVDPLSGALRYFTNRVVNHLKATDTPPSDTIPIPRKDKCASILEQSSSMYRKNRPAYLAKCDPQQPVIRAWRVNLKRNWLDKTSDKDYSLGPECYICPEPLEVSVLPTDIAAAGFVFPSIMFRLDSYLIALEAFEKLSLSVEPEYALEAMTKDSDNTYEHRVEQIHVQRGMGKNYERLEFFGDCFLKMAVSISIFALHPEDNEYFLHVTRMTLVCNKNLRGSAIDLELFKHIRSSGFERSIWYPDNLKLLHGTGAGKERPAQTHVLGDKTVADVAEAVIGAAYLSCVQARNMDNAVRAVTKLVSSPHHAVDCWKDYYKLYKLPTYQTVNATASHLHLAAEVEKKDNYHFRYPRLLRSAFTHPSCPFVYEKVPSYQRLEFLGDSLYDMVCVEWLYNRFPDKDPQWLTEHKMAMVSNRFQGALCVRLGFHKHLRMMGDFVRKQIFEYIQDLTEAEEAANRSPDYWLHLRSPPKALPDIVEAYIGAIFVDSEFDYSQVERFFNDHVVGYFENMEMYDSFANNHPTTYLHNLLTLQMGCGSYRVWAAESLPALPGVAAKILAGVMIHETVVAEGHAESGKNAKVAASKAALTLLEGTTPAEFRKKYGCDCKLSDAELMEVGIEGKASAI
ncbi:MAG: Dicer-like protein 1 [Vezdaea aestivalis]|nr:MAG: Dicer-like protein 1 [Vezdaea aestivalis]